MKYIVALPRDVEHSKPSEVCIVNTSLLQSDMVLKTFSLLEESSGRTYSPQKNGLYVHNNQIFVSVKDGVLCYILEGEIKKQYKASSLPKSVNVDVAGAMACVNNTLYWSLTNLPNKKEGQEGIGLFKGNNSSLERVLESVAPVGPLAVLDDGILFYLENDNTKKEGRIFCYKDKSLAVSRNLQQFQDVLYPQPRGLCTDDHFVYSIGKKGIGTKEDPKKETIALTLFDHTLKEKAEHAISLSDSTCTAFALYSGNFNPIAVVGSGLDFHAMYHKPCRSYGIIGLNNGNIALVKVGDDSSLTCINLLAEFSLFDEGTTRTPVKNILTQKKQSKKINNAEIVVVYDKFTISLTSYELLTNVALETAIGRPKEVIALQFLDGDKRVQLFDRDIIASALLGDS